MLEEKGTILIVDDNPENLRVLNEIMSKQGYNARPANTGELALESVKFSLPDLILLDIRMPNMNGYEVCKIIKNDPKTRHIPIIFLSGLNETQDKVEAFKIGGNDYITKPFQVEEVLARVEVQLSNHRLKLDLAEKNELLKSEIEERIQIEQELVKSQSRLETKAHDLNERIKELNCLYNILKLTENHGLSLHETLKGVVDLIPPSWHFPDSTCARISLENQFFQSSNFQKTENFISSEIRVDGEAIGTLEVYYLGKPSQSENSPFLKEESDLLHVITKHLGMAITRYKNEKTVLEAKQTADRANQAKSEFLANISHELRNPMHQILSYSKYGVEKIDTPKDKLKHYFHQIRGAAQRLMNLLNDLLDLSKMESGKMDYQKETSDLFQIISDAVHGAKLLLEKNQLQVNLDKPSFSTIVLCDPFRIGQVISNILSNAIKFSPQKSQISIIFEQVIELESNSSIKVSVADQGPGIPEQEVGSIFDKFTQSSKTKSGLEGTGLGLAICKEIILNHGGQIWAENNSDSGSTFAFTLPKRP